MPCISSVFFLDREGISMKHKRIVPWIVYMIFFAVLNETMFNVSTPMIAEQFSLSASGVSWMMNLFMIFFGIGAVVYGRLADIFSLKRLITAGICIYAAGSIVGFVFQFSYPLVMLGRALQGMGGSAIPALVFIVVARYFETSERGKIFGFITSMVSLSIGLGPVIGGFVASALHWSFLFLIPLLILVSIPFVNRALPAEEKRPGRVDVPGAGLVALTIGNLVLFLNLNEWYFLAGFIVMFALTVVESLLAKDPFIKPSLFKNKKYVFGVIVGFTLFSAVIGIVFLIPLLLNNVHGFDPGLIGLVLFPGAMSSVVIGPIAGNLADRRGNPFVVRWALVLILAGLFLMALLLGLSAIVIAGGMLLLYMGFAMFQTSMVNSVSQTLSRDETGAGMGVFNLASVMSGVVGTALVGKILDVKWLDFRMVSLVPMSSGYDYGNLMLLFSLVIGAGGIVYLLAFGHARVGTSESRAAEGILDEAECPAC